MSNNQLLANSPITFWVVDAFTNHAFSGNPAAVSFLESFPDTSVMQQFAAEINLSETCFVTQSTNDRFHIRWFTPTCEVSLCGHATLATAFLIREHHRSDADMIHFDSLSGPLSAHLGSQRISLEFPLYPTHEVSVESVVANALNVDIDSVQCAAVGSTSDSFLIYCVDSYETVQSLRPNFLELMSTPRAVLITSDAPSEPKTDFVYRLFAPQYGINEDPVTGSAQCVLADFWSKRLKKTSFLSKQLSMRGGTLYSSIKADRIHISGDAVSVFKLTTLI